MSTVLPLPLSVADLPVGATFTHKGVEYRKVKNKGMVNGAMIMAARHPDHPDVGTVGGSLGGVKVLSICHECPASTHKQPQGRSCTDIYDEAGKHLPCRVGGVAASGPLILTIDTAYEMALAGCASW